MRRYSLLKSIFMSCYDRSVYQDAKTHWRGIGVTYLLLLMAVVWLPLTFRFHQGLNSFISEQILPVTEQMPTITVKRGELTMDRPAPYVVHLAVENQLPSFVVQSDGGYSVHDQSKKQPYLVIDPSGRYQSLKDTPAQVLVTKHAMMMREEGGEVKSVQFTDETNFTLTPQRAREWLETANQWLPAIFYVMMVFLSLLYRLLVVLGYGLVGHWIIARSLKITMDYQAATRLAALAVTPSVLIHTATEYFGVKVPLAPLLFAVLTIGYLIYGIRACRT